MSYISPTSPFYEPPNLKVKEQPFQIDEKVRPHINFRNHYPDVKECTVESCEKGFCESGWLVTVKEFKNERLGKQIYDSGWFFKIK